MPRPRLIPGEPAPWFHCRSNVNPRFAFDTLGGRYVVLCFFGTAGDPQSQELLGGLHSLQPYLDDEFACLFGVSVDPQDEALGRTPDWPVGVRFFYDFDLVVSRLYGVVDSEPSASVTFERRTVILDERLRIVQVLEFETGPAVHIQQLASVLASLPPLPPPQPAVMQAPVLVVPRVFEPELCQALIQYYQSRGGKESGFMRDVDGKTVEIVNYDHKRRRDEEIVDENLRRACMVRIHDRLAPELKKAFQFEATRIERYVVA